MHLYLKKALGAGVAVEFIALAVIVQKNVARVTRGSGRNTRVPNAQSG
jgi:hypothetical protein